MVKRRSRRQSRRSRKSLKGSSRELDEFDKLLNDPPVKYGNKLAHAGAARPAAKLSAAAARPAAKHSAGAARPAAKLSAAQNEELRKQEHRIIKQQLRKNDEIIRKRDGR